MRDIRALLPTAAVSASLLFAVLAWRAHARAVRSGESGFAAFFGARNTFAPLDFTPQPLRRESPAPAAPAPAGLPPVEWGSQYDALPGAEANPSSAFSVGDRPAVTIYLAPWSTMCHDVVSQVRRVRGELALRGVDTRIVIGLDSQDKLDAFASEVGGDIVFEPGAQTTNPAKGLPAFVVTDGKRITAARVGTFHTDGEASQWAVERLGL